MSTQQQKYRIDRSDSLRQGKGRVYRIIALKDFADVKAGDKGGYIQDISNLDQEGTCWVYGNPDPTSPWDNPMVMDSARITEHAVVFGRATVGGSSVITDYARIGGGATVDDCFVCGNTEINDRARVYYSEMLKGGVSIRDNAYVSFSTLGPNVNLLNKAHVAGGELVRNVEMRGESMVEDSVVKGAVLCGSATLTDCDLDAKTELGGYFHLGDGLMFKDCVAETEAYLRLDGNARFHNCTFVVFGPDLDGSIGSTKDHQFYQNRSFNRANLENAINVTKDTVEIQAQLHHS